GWVVRALVEIKNSVWPSAGEPVSSRKAGMKLPPALFSTKTVVRRFSLIFCATSRAITSVAPPAASPTRRRIGLLERSCAVAAGGGAQNRIAQTRRPNTVRRCMRSSLAMREAQLFARRRRRHAARERGLLRLDAMGVDELRPVCDLVLELRFQRIAGGVARLDIEIGQPFAHARIRQGGRNGLVQLSLDGVRNSSGSEESEPEAQVYVRGLDPGFFERRNVRQDGRTLGAGDREPLDLARFDEALRDLDRCHIEGHVPGDHVVHGRPAALVGDVNRVHSRSRPYHFKRQMRDAADAGGGVIYFLRHLT